MSRLFLLDHDGFHRVLSWLDFGSICHLDIAVGSTVERLLWLRSLNSTAIKAFDEYEHCHSSIRWLIRRGARATRIQARKSDRTSNNRITDQTFAGLGFLPTLNASLSTRRSLSILRSIGSFILEKCRITNREVRKQGFSNLTSMDLNYCSGITDGGVSAIAQGCPHLTSINLTRSEITDISLSAIAEGCPQLTSIDLTGCYKVSDMGVSGFVMRCSHLSSINLACCGRISDDTVLAIAEGCPNLTCIDFTHSNSVSDTAISALVRGCTHLTSINQLSVIVYQTSVYQLFLWAVLISNLSIFWVVSVYQKFV